MSLILERKNFDVHVMEVEREGLQLSTRSKRDTKVFFSRDPILLVCLLALQVF